ncbi:MAG: ferritin family protein [Thermodesulfovibrionales bacterium]|nr:ferritin family protein [Thermodesulfovibrionales bacterium]
MSAIEIATKMETDAIKFYKEASEKTSHPVGKQMFLSIVEDEKRHLQMLSDLLKGLSIKIADTHPMQNIKTVFEDMKDKMMQRISASNDDLEAFKIAMEMEAEGKNFYIKHMDSLNTDAEKNLFKTLAQEEEEHFKVFSNTYNFLKDTGNWFMWEERSIVEG